MMMGALDGLLSVASVMLGVGGGTGDLNSMRLAGLASWIAGALSMFLGGCPMLPPPMQPPHAATPHAAT
jgi:VIT1/CCC1 family predicted Fe2+/Mn2+ transporter